MIIDFHTHIFPDDLAPRAMATLLKQSERIYEPVHNGALSGLLRNMDDWHIGASVVLPVITKASQTKSTNEWARSICSDRIIGFGSIYPHTDNYKKDIDFVAGLGLKGLKFHAEYQDFILDEDKMLRIYDYALGKGLILLHHAGFDPSFPPPYRSTPKQFARIDKLMQGGVIIAAHLGGHAYWNETEEILAGSGIYLDTSMGFDYYSREQFLRIAKKHGTDKLLFGSDAPWSSAEKEIKEINALPLAESDIHAILGGNAKRLLGV